MRHFNPTKTKAQSLLLVALLAGIGASRAAAGGACPDAVDDGFTTDSASPVVGNLFDDNGSGVDTGTGISLTAIDGNSANVGYYLLPSGAEVQTDSSGAFDFAPLGVYDYMSSGDSTQEVISYTIGDGICEDTATVTITINGLDDNPIAYYDELEVSEEGGDIYPLANDDAVDSADTITINSVDDSTYGTFTNFNSYLAFNPDSTANTLGQDEEFIEDLDYTIQDNAGNMASNVIHLTINGVNDAPVAFDDSITISANDTIVDITVLDNDEDVDNGDVKHLTGVSIASYGDTALNGDYVSYTVNNASVAYVPLGSSVSDVLSYGMEDNYAASSSASIYVTINGENDAPVPSPDSATTDEDAGPFSTDVLSNDSDVDQGDVLSLNSVGAGLYGTAVVDGNEVSYTPDNANLQYLETGESLEDAIAYFVEDNNGSIVEGVLTITINGVSETDSDGDGIFDADEANGPNGGDANGDGIQDSTQPEVASLLDTAGTSYVTVVAANGGTLTNVSTAVPPDSGFGVSSSYPAGCVGFQLNGVDTSSTPAVVDLYFATAIPSGFDRFLLGLNVSRASQITT